MFPQRAAARCYRAQAARAPSARLLFPRRTFRAATTPGKQPHSTEGASGGRGGVNPPKPPPGVNVGTPHRLQQVTDVPEGPVSWRNLVITAMFTGGILGIFLTIKKEKDKKYEEQKTKHAGKARIGGPYSMVDHHGKPITSAHFHGKFALIYFGFVNCPDICPAEMKRLSAVIDAVDADPELKDEVQPVFISVDPARDSVAEVAEYVADYHPKLIGLTGTRDQVERTTKSFRVYFHRASEISEEDYLIDHSIIMYLMDRNGEFVDFFGTNMTLEQIQERVMTVVRKDREEAGEIKKAWWKTFLGF